MKNGSAKIYYREFGGEESKEYLDLRKIIPGDELVIFWENGGSERFIAANNFRECFGKIFLSIKDAFTGNIECIRNEGLRRCVLSFLSRLMKQDPMLPTDIPIIGSMTPKGQIDPYKLYVGRYAHYTNGKVGNRQIRKAGYIREGKIIQIIS